MHNCMYIRRHRPVSGGRSCGGAGSRPPQCRAGSRRSRHVVSRGWGSDHLRATSFFFGGPEMGKLKWVS